MNIKPIALAACLLLGCEDHAQEVHTTTNPNYDVALMFEYDGCKVYRFEASLHTHYFVRCQDGAASTSTAYTESCGKNCTREVHEEIQTVRPQ